MSQDNHRAVVPETLEGWAILHGIFRINWPSWKRLDEQKQRQILDEAAEYLHQTSPPREGESALFSLLGHKGDLLLLHFRPTLDLLNEAEIGFRRLSLAEHLEETTSYVSYLELGLYEMTIKLHEQLLADGLQPGTDEWKKKWRAEMDNQRERMKGRLFMPIPDLRYLCFYPMSKRRGEKANWYNEPIEKRQMLMRDHGMVGRKYTGQVTQIITGSIGFDDWEWGVYLFSDDPLVFKKLVYEMRFDEATVWYGEFGQFFISLRVRPHDLHMIFAGQVPEWSAAAESDKI